MSNTANLIMTPDDFKRQMEEAFSSGDTEMDHEVGDNLLCDLLRQLGYDDGVDVFEKAKKWYS